MESRGACGQILPRTWDSCCLIWRPVSHRARAWWSLGRRDSVDLRAAGEGGQSTSDGGTGVDQVVEIQGHHRRYVSCIFRLERCSNQGASAHRLSRVVSESSWRRPTPLTLRQMTSRRSRKQDQRFIRDFTCSKYMDSNNGL